METEEMRLQGLARAGRTLSFTGFDISAYPGYDTSVIYTGKDTYFEPDTQKYTFQTTAAIVSANSIVAGDTFTYSDGTYTFSYTIADIVPDLEGWCIISAILSEYSDV